jgi:GTP-binding protein
VHRGRNPKVYYATQISSQPPTLVLVCNQPKAFSSQYRRYLLGVFRDQLEFGEVPIKLYLQKRSESDRRDDHDDRESPEPEDRGEQFDDAGDDE